VNDELGLTAGALQGHHRCTGYVGGDLCAKVASDKMEAQIQSGGGACRGHQCTMVNVQDVGIDGDRRKPARQLRSGKPVCRRDASIESARARQNERAGANRRDARAAADCSAQFRQQCERNRAVQIIDPGYDDRVGFTEKCYWPPNGQVEMCRFGLRSQTAHADVVRRTPIGIAGAPEHLARCGKVAEHNTVEGDDCDEVPPPRASSSNSWRNSGEYWRFGHWPDYGAILRMESMTVMDVLGPAIGASAFVLVMSLVREPTRRTVNAVIVAGASGVYLSGGFGIWELAYPVLVMPVVYRALQSHRYIGVAWLMHAAWDLPHHLWGNPIWPFMRTSSFGCFVFDSLIAAWFLAGAPAVARRADNYLAEARPR
jgi:hypothetical protein